MKFTPALLSFIVVAQISVQAATPPYVDPFPVPKQVGATAIKPVFIESFEAPANKEAGVVGKGASAGSSLTQPTPPELQGAKRAMTLEFWAKGGALSGFLEGPGFSVSGQGNMGAHGSHMVSFDLAQDGAFVGKAQAVLALPPEDNAWRHYVVSTDGQYISAYVDGELLERRWLTNSTNQIGPMHDGTNVVKHPSITINSNAQVDELRIYDRALDPMQVRKNFENYRVYSLVVYVAPNGRGNGNNAVSPMSLSAALKVLRPGTKLILKAGTYNGADFQISEVSGQASNQATLILGEPGSAPVIIECNAANAAPSVGRAGWLTLRNLHFVNKSTLPPQALAIREANGPVVLDACHFKSVTSGLVVENSARVTVENNVFQVKGTGLSFSASPNAIVRNNTIQGGEIGLTFTKESKGLRSVHNLIAGQTGKCLVIDSSSSSQPGGDSNAYAPAQGGLVASVDGVDFPKGDLFAFHEKFLTLVGGKGGNEGRVSRLPELNSFLAEPVFLDLAAGDLRLKRVPGNVIDAGLASTLADFGGATVVEPALWDATGAERPLPHPLDLPSKTGGNAPDVGAYETSAPLSFAFDLPGAKSASAGVYNQAGQLVRTLFSGRRLAAGKQEVFWNGLDDERKPAPPGAYKIKVLANNFKYVWQGAIGHSAVPATGHNATVLFFCPPLSMAVGPKDDVTYYALGYQEAFKPIWRMKDENRNQVEKRMGFEAGTNSKVISDVATDGKRAYFASPMGASSSQPCAGFITAFNVEDDSQVQGDQWLPIEGTPYFGILVGKPGKNQELAISSVAVQTEGNLLFAATRSENKVYVFDKITGKKMDIEIPVENPRDIAVNDQGDLWVASSKTLQRFSAKNGWKLPVKTIENLASPVALAWTPFNYGAPGTGGTVLVADGGDSQQVKAFSGDNGSAVWTQGQPGGYANGIEVTTDKFQFGTPVAGEKELVPGTFVCALPDGGFWVQDHATSRVLKFGPDRAYQEKESLSAMASFYSVAVDANNPKRVFAGFTEYQIDYDKPFGPHNGSWAPVRYFGHAISGKNHGFQEGLADVTTLSNGRTYATSNGLQEFVELTPQGMRETGISTAFRDTGTPWQFQPDGSLTATAPVSPVAPIFKRDLTGFDEAGNPQWGDPRKVAEVPYRANAIYQDPLYIEAIEDKKSGALLTYVGSTEGGPKLGAVKPDGKEWLWRAARSARLDGRGAWDSSGQFAGANALTGILDGMLVLIYRGEFWANVQANQFMQYSTDGLFLGQWGVGSNIGHDEGPVPGRSSNMMSSGVTRVGDHWYVFANDESGNSGIATWRIDGLESLEEFSGEVAVAPRLPQ